MGEGLLGKTVKIADKSLLQIFYPDFIIKDTLFFDNENSVIYTGKFRKDLLTYLKDNTKEFINTTGLPDIDLDIRENLLDFVYGKYNRKPKEETVDLLSNWSDEDFYNFIKIYWVCGKSNLDEEKNHTIFDLYKSFGKSKLESLKILFSLLEGYSPTVIESSVITFIEKSMNYEEVNASAYYLKLLKEFRDKYGDKVKATLYKYCMMEDKPEVKLIWLLLNF